MKIRYDSTLEDLLAYQFHFIDNSRTLQRTRRLTLLIINAAVILSTLALVGTSEEPGNAKFVLLIPAAIFCLVFTVISLKTSGRSYRPRLLAVYREGSTKTLIGPRELELTPTALIVRAPLVESHYDWKGIDQVVETDEYAFIQNSPVSAIIIPKNRLMNGDSKTFLEEVRTRIIQHRDDGVGET